jgi:hypothetical protein
VLTTSNLDECRPLWGDRETYDQIAFERTIERVRWLLERDLVRGRILRDADERARAFGVSAFITDVAGERMSNSPTPQLGRQLLEDPAWERIVLNPAAVGRANAATGLQLLVVNQGYDTAIDDSATWAALIGRLIQAFIETHRGYRIQRVIIEQFGRRGAAFIAQSWPHVTCSDIPSFNGGVVPSARWSVTRDLAERQGGGLLPLFLYRRPVLGFSPAEKAVLRAALVAGTDAAIASALALPVATVKSRWSRILRRVATTSMGPRLAPDRAGDHRGPQSRHLLLDHLRHNPWELTPYEPNGTK